MTLKAELTNIPLSYASALRRFSISEVPCMAIDEVVILENSSIMYDELISHRLGLVPLRTDLSRFVLPEDCDCGSSLGCSQCRVLLVLDVEAKDGTMTVYCKDMVSEDEWCCAGPATAAASTTVSSMPITASTGNSSWNVRAGPAQASGDEKGRVRKPAGFR